MLFLFFLLCCHRICGCLINTYGDRLDFYMQSIFSSQKCLHTVFMNKTKFYFLKNVFFCVKIITHTHTRVITWKDRLAAIFQEGSRGTGNGAHMISKRQSFRAAEGILLLDSKSWPNSCSCSLGCLSSKFAFSAHLRFHKIFSVSVLSHNSALRLKQT